MQRSEGQLHLRLHASGPCQLAVRRPPGQVFKQRRLAHARLAVQHQGAAFPRTNGRDEPIKHVAFSPAVGQLRAPAAHHEPSRKIRTIATLADPPAHWPQPLASSGYDTRRPPAACYQPANARRASCQRRTITIMSTAGIRSDAGDKRRKPCRTSKSAPRTAPTSTSTTGTTARVNRSC